MFKTLLIRFEEIIYNIYYLNYITFYRAAGYIIKTLKLKIRIEI